MEEQDEGSSPVLGDQNEKERTPEQIAMIHAAMMEELGIGRMDTLPLEDGRHNGYVPITNTQKLNPPANAAISRWQNLEFNDVDEVFHQLDNIADGQLYRLRQGVLSARSSAGKGHHSLSNSSRGNAGSATRGGRGGQSAGVGRGRGGSNGSKSAKSVTYSNEHSRGPSKHARIEAAIAHLRAPPRTAAPASNRSHQSIPTTANTRPAIQPVTHSHFAASLASPESFLAAAGFTARVSPASTIQQTLPNSGNVFKNESPKHPGIFAPQKLAQSAPSITSSSRHNESPTLGSESVQVGLQGSRWATPAATSRPPVVEASLVIPLCSVTPFQVAHAMVRGTLVPTPLIIPTPVVPGNEILTSAAKPRTLPATAIIPGLPGRDIAKECNIKVVKKNGESWGPDQMGVVRIINQTPTGLEIEVGNIIVRTSIVSGHLIWEASGSIVIFNIKCEVFQLTFRLPHEFHSFVKFLPLHLKKDCIPTQDRQAQLANAAIVQIAAPISLATSDIVEAPVTRLPTISSATLSDIYSLASVLPPLIDFSEDIVQQVSTQPQSGSAAEDLAVLADDSTQEAIPQQVYCDPRKSILEHTSSTAAKLHDNPIVSVAENLVEGRLRNNEYFALSSDSLAATYTEEAARNVLDKAQSQGEAGSSITETVQVVQSCDVPCSSTEIAETATIINVADPLSSKPATTKAEAVVDNETHPVRISQTMRYSITELLSHRSQASIVMGELIPQNEIYGFILPQQLPRTSRAEFAAAFAFQPPLPASEKEWNSKPASNLLTPKGALKLSQGSTENKAANSSSQYQHTDPALWEALLKSVSLEKPDESPQVPSRGSRHGPKASEWDLPQLARSFEELQIAAATKSSPASHTADDINQTLHAGKSALSQLSISAVSSSPLFNAGQTIKLNQLFEETEQSSILKVSNKREEVAKAKLPGLSSSKWATSEETTSFTPKARNHRVSIPPSVIQTPSHVENRPFVPVYHTFLVPDPTTGRFLEAKGILKSECDQLAPENAGNTSRHVENISFQNMASSPLTPSIPYRFPMHHGQLFDSSPKSDFKADAPIFKPASRALSDRDHLDNSTSVSTSRPALSPIRRRNVQAALQSRLDRSIAERHGSSPGSQN